MWTIAVRHHPQEWSHHRNQDSLFNAHKHHNGRSNQCQRVLARALAPDVQQPRKSISRTAMKNTIAPSTQRGRYCIGPVRKSRTSATTTAVATCASWLFPPELSTIAVCVDCRSQQTSRRTPPPRWLQTSQSDPDFHPVAAGAVQRRARRRRTLCNDHYEGTIPETPTSGRASLQLTSGKPRCGNPPTTGPTMVTPRPANPIRTGCNCTRHRYQRARKFRSKVAAGKYEHQYDCRDQCRQQMDMLNIARNLDELNGRPVRVHFKAEHSTQHRHANLDAHPRQKTHQHRLRQKVS